ncbi:MAG TPA: MAPEG family protein [Rhodocyclaceae bacterium]|nr:MAPEG family protein [Rhodocyclaceae bacterium]
MNLYPYTAAVTLLVLLLLFATAANVGRARGRYGVKAPATSGHEMFDRAFRIQMNTLENAVQMLPALWLCAVYSGDRLAGLLGLVWLLVRVWYALAYQQDPAKRGAAFGLSFLAFAALWLGAAWGLAHSLA